MAAKVAYYWAALTVFVLVLARADTSGVSYDDLIVLECDVKVRITFFVRSTTPMLFLDGMHVKDIVWCTVPVTNTPS